MSAEPAVAPGTEGRTSRAAPPLRPAEPASRSSPVHRRRPSETVTPAFGYATSHGVQQSPWLTRQPEDIASQRPWQLHARVMAHAVVAADVVKAEREWAPASRTETALPSNERVPSLVGCLSPLRALNCGTHDNSRHVS